jgi:hypothetical protein
MSKKDKIKGVVYSTNKEFSYDFESEETQETLPPHSLIPIQIKKQLIATDIFSHYRFCL